MGLPRLSPGSFSLFFLILILAAGCSGQAPAATPEPTSPPSPSTVTATPTVLPSPTPAGACLAPRVVDSPTPAASETIVRIKSLSSGTYLCDDNGRAILADVPPDNRASQWILEAYQGATRIRNRASGNYLSIEHLQGYVEVIPVESVWMSPRWTLETGSREGSTILRNVWHSWQVLSEADGLVKYDQAFEEGDLQTEWELQGAAGSALPQTTETPLLALPTASQPASQRGAAVPWIEYEAEAGHTNGKVLPPDRAFGTFSAESSGRRAVRLNQTGDFVQFQSLKAANSIVVRYIIPDSEDGSGLEAGLSLYVNNVFRQKLHLTSKYAWSYGGEQLTLNTPKAGGAHHFYDEARALVGDIPAGAAVKLQKDPDDTVGYYVIDLIDLEAVAPPKTMPEGYVSITDLGAVADDGVDDGDAIQAAIELARAWKTGVWIPPGTFESTIHPLEVKDVTLQGAGMWNSVIHGLYARFNCSGDNCRFFDFAILGETTTRDDKSPENGFNGGAGSGSRLENIWVEHTKVGYWVGGGTNGLVIINSRFRNLFADGVNFCSGTSNSIVENSHFRNTGDDAVASWSPQGSGVNSNNVFRFNTVQGPWRANCFAVYGGSDNRIEDNLCLDVVTYPGILIAQQFNSNPFGGTTVVQRNSLVRAGGPMFNQQWGALKIWTDQGELPSLIVKDLLIEEPTFSGIEIEGSYELKSAVFEDIHITHPGTYGILIRSSVSGQATFSNVVVTGAGEKGLLNYGPKLKFRLDRGKGNSGW